MARTGAPVGRTALSVCYLATGDRARFEQPTRRPGVRRIGIEIGQWRHGRCQLGGLGTSAKGPPVLVLPATMAWPQEGCRTLRP
jgi:hypothetical protein